MIIAQAADKLAADRAGTPLEVNESIAPTAEGASGHQVFTDLGGLDQTINAQFEEKARALADRTMEVDAQLAARRQDLESEFAQRCTEAESPRSP